MLPRRLFLAHRRRKVSASVFGFSFVEIIITLGISSFMMIVVRGQISQLYSLMGSIAIDAEIQEISASLSKQISCERTLLSINATNNNSGPPPTTQVQLLNRSGKPILNNHSLGGVYAPYRAVSSSWLVSATWTGNSLALSLGKAGGNNQSWAKDPSTGASLDVSSQKTQLYNDPPAGIPLCPRSASNSVLENLDNSTTDVINPLVGLPAKLSYADFALNPASGNKACHLYCRSKNYAAGRIIAGSDGYSVYDKAGNFVKSENFPPGKSIVTCGCYL